MKLKDSQLIKALLEDDYNAMECIINECGINAVDRDQRNLLMNCVVKNKINFVVNILKNDKLDVNNQDYQGFTALHLAIENNLLEIVQLLLKDSRISIDIQDNWGNTPLWRAVHNNPDNRDIINALISKGANPQISNKHGVSPLQIMKEDQEEGSYDYSDIIGSVSD